MKKWEVGVIFHSKRVFSRDIQLIVPSVYDLAECKSAKDVTNNPAPEANGLNGFEGSAIFIPGPVLQNTIISSNMKNPFKLIPIISRTARSFDKEHKLEATAVTHADDLSAWLYGVKVGLVLKMRYSVNPDNPRLQLSVTIDTCNASLQT